MDPQSASSSYRPRGYGISPALQRAREPYRIRNAVTGALLVGFAVSVWAYSISAVKQDNFDDIDAAVIDSRQAAPVAAETSPSALTAHSSSSPLVEPSPVVAATSKPSFSMLGQFRPTILDSLSQFRSPTDGRVVVWGAPPLNKLGSVGDRTTAPWAKNV